MKIGIMNVDFKPYRVEFELLETSTSYPHLRIDFAGYTIDRLCGLPADDILASITVLLGEEAQ